MAAAGARHHFEPYAQQLIRDERGNVVQAVTRQAVDTAGLLARLPRRIDKLATRMEEGRLAVDAPRVDRRLARLERLGRRILSAVLFGALLIGGILLRPDDPVLGTVLLIAAVPPLLHALLAGVLGSRGPV